MRRLYLQFYLTIIASLVAVVIAAGTLWRFAPNETPSDQAFEMAGALLAAQVAPADASEEAQRRSIEQLYGRLRVDLGLFDGNRRLLAAAGGPVPAPPGRRDTGNWVYGPGGPAWAIRLPDGRWVVARPPPRQHAPRLRVIAFLGTIALVVALCAYPIARRLTRRLERLQAGVDSLGRGDLAARVKVEGKDEVARLAESFNRAAARIAELVAAHKMLLANTSHELRTPLSRIRLGIELLKETPNAENRAELERDIAELDGLVEQILLSSRLDAVQAIDRKEEVDLLAVAAEEGVRYDNCSVDGQPVMVRGDRAMLQRMVRNLLDNAQRHGIAPIEVSVRRDEARAVLVVFDRGPGVAAGEEERIFSPFYRARNQQAAPGAGLGLTLVRQIARRHGGDASWAGTPERPSAIRVAIPSVL
jgi:signal transduction histidine kinase